VAKVTLFLYSIAMHRLFIIGDSTAAVKKDEARPETGWGEAFGKYIKGDWILDNRAKNGVSTRSCLLEGIFSSVLLVAEEGDAAIIEFGHNDSKPDEHRHSDPWIGYRANLIYMANELHKKGVDVFFATSIARRRFDGDTLLETHGDYPAAMKAAAHDAAVPVVDMTIPTMLEIQRLGDNESKKLFMNFGPGLYDNFPNGKEDNTHLRPEGAEWIASLVAKKLSELEVVPLFLKAEKVEVRHLEDFSLQDEKN